MIVLSNVICKNTKLFQTVFKSICSFSEEIEVIIDSERLSIRGISENHLIYSVAIFPKSFFDSYRLSGIDKFSVWFDSKNISKIFSSIKPKEAIELIFLRNEMMIKLYIPYERKYILKYKEPLAIEVFKIYNEYTNLISLNPNLFYQILMEVDKISDEINISFIENILKITALNNDVRFIYEENYDIKLKDVFSKSILVKSLKWFIPTLKQASNLYISINNQKPFIMKVDINGSSNINIYIVLSSKHIN